jgi:hypothetical protein
MSRIVFIILIIMLCMTSYGCAVLRDMDGSSDEIMQLRRVNNQLWNETTRLKQENVTCKQTMNDKQNEIDQLNKIVDDYVKDLKPAEVGVKKAEGVEQKALVKADTEDKSVKDEVIPVKETPAGVKEKMKDASSPEKDSLKQDRKADVEKKEVDQKAVAAEEVDLKKLKMKVLSGNGKISPAKIMSGKLVKMGYRVDIIGIAPRSNFDRNTVYFAPEYKNEAQRLASQLGGATIFKPLTWPSIFHMILVTVP